MGRNCVSVDMGAEVVGIPAVYFIPPSESYETSSGDVFEVVEVGGEQEDCEDEY